MTDISQSDLEKLQLNAAQPFGITARAVLHLLERLKALEPIQEERANWQRIANERGAEIMEAQRTSVEGRTAVLEKIVESLEASAAFAAGSDDATSKFRSKLREQSIKADALLYDVHRLAGRVRKIKDAMAELYERTSE